MRPSWTSETCCCCSQEVLAEYSMCILFPHTHLGGSGTLYGLISAYRRGDSELYGVQRLAVLQCSSFGFDVLHAAPGLVSQSSSLGGCQNLGWSLSLLYSASSSYARLACL